MSLYTSGGMPGVEGIESWLVLWLLAVVSSLSSCCVHILFCRSLSRNYVLSL